MSEFEKLPANLPEDWQATDIITPNGVENGYEERFGYNYLMKQVNAAHKKMNEFEEDAGKAIYEPPELFNITPIANVNGTPFYTPVDPVRGRHKNGAQKMPNGLTVVDIAFEMPEGKVFPGGAYAIAAIPIEQAPIALSYGVLSLAVTGATTYPIMAYIRPQGATDQAGRIIVHNTYDKPFKNMMGTLIYYAKDEQEGE